MVEVARTIYVQEPKKVEDKKKLSESDIAFEVVIVDVSEYAIERSKKTGKILFEKIKIFKIMAEKYRNRRRRFGLRLNLITCILNYEIEVCC